MSTFDYITYSALFVAILATQLGRREPDAKRLLLPLVAVGAIGFKYIRHLPTGSMSHLLEVGGLLVGVVFGVISVLLVQVEKNPENGKLVTIARWPYALVLAARLAFAYGSTHWFEAPLAAFSVAHHVPGTAYAAAFVLMVVAMISVRTAVVVLRAHQVGAQINTSSLNQRRSGGLVSKVHDVVR
jgi:hypothetical protein